MPSLSELQAQAASFDATISKAVADRVVPGVVLLAENKTGTFTYEKTLGLSSLEPGRETQLRGDAVFPLLSLSKLVTAVLCRQAVERGLVDLDADVAPLLPELAAVPVLRGFDAATGAPQLERRARPITLRLLLTHSAGTTYPFFGADVARYRRWHAAQTPEALAAAGAAAGLPGPPPPPPPPPPPSSSSPPPPASVEAHCCDPLVFQPGEGWQYGCGVDWAGRLLERVHGGATTLEDLVARDVVAPLGLAPGALTFFPARFPDVAARLWPSLPVRSAPGQPVGHGPSPFAAATATATATDDTARLGGEGLFAAMPAYAAVLRSLLRDDGKLVRTGSDRDWLTGPQLATDAARARLRAACAHDTWITGNVPRDTADAYDWSLAGLVVTDAAPAHPHRRAGTVTWSGALNLSWVLDRGTGLWALFGSSFAPYGDAEGNALMAAFEAHVYEAAAKL